MRHPYTPQRPGGVLAPPALPLLVPLRLQELAQAGQAAPGCLRYELRQADGDSDLWLLHSEWSDDAAMQAYLAGDAQRVFAEVLWQALAATLDVQERPF
ncbi:antibiotic biosynthesis monooxygenase [Pseudomonas aeruginosa]|nr:antibiotic biosynthesis monooxygenase [Pseudomonas aeruginosa]